MRIRDQFIQGEFQDLLNDAEIGAKTDNESAFISDMMDKYEEWGNDMYISEAQIEWLERLAERESP